MGRRQRAIVALHFRKRHHETSPQKFPRIWRRALPTSGCRVSHGRKPIRRGRCVSSSAFRPVGPTTSRARLIAQSCRSGSASSSSSRTGRAPAPISATEAVASAAADGYTLLLVTAANAINATLYDKLNFNFIRDIAPVAGIIRAPIVMVVNPSVPAKTVPEFIAYAKANPGKINMASAGNGSSAPM